MDIIVSFNEIVDLITPTEESAFGKTLKTTFSKAFGQVPNLFQTPSHLDLKTYLLWQNSLNQITIEIKKLPQFNEALYDELLEKIMLGWILSVLDLPFFNNAAIIDEIDFRSNNMALLAGLKEHPHFKTVIGIIRERKQKIEKELAIEMPFNLWRHGKTSLNILETLLKNYQLVDNQISLSSTYTHINPPKVNWKSNQNELIYLLYLINEKSNQFASTTIHVFASKSFTVEGKEVKKENFSKSLSKVFRLYENEKREKTEGILLVESIAKDCLSSR